LNFGTSTAEKDPLLPSAQIRTQEFWDLYNDRIDLVRGIKGAGKTALYRVFDLLKDDLARTNRLFCIFGVEATGDPVFNHFSKFFGTYGPTEFEKFWGLYFLTLIRNKIKQDSALTTLFNAVDSERFDRLWETLEIPNPDGGLFGIVQALVNKIKGVRKVEGTVKVEPSVTGVAYQPGVALEFDKKEAPVETPVYVGDARDEIGNLLREKNTRIWIFLLVLSNMIPRRQFTRFLNYGSKVCVSLKVAHLSIIVGLLWSFQLISDWWRRPMTRISPVSGGVGLWPPKKPIYDASLPQ
jgi:hypothetical protein